MKNSKPLREVQDDYQSKTVGLCLSCEKPCRMWWGRIGDVGVCSAGCQRVYNSKTALKNADLRVHKRV